MRRPVLPHWRQIDAGIWHRTAERGHVEIAYATGRDAKPLYEISVFDDRGRAITVTGPSAFSSLDEARRFADAHHLPGLVSAAA